MRLFRWSVPVKNAQTSPLTDCICRYFLALLAVIFHPSFLIFFFSSADETFLGRHLRHLFVIRFIKSIFSTIITITGITSIVLTFIVIFKELLLKGLPNTRKGQWLVTSCKGTFRYHFVCVFFAQRSCKNYIALVYHTGWRNLYLKWQIWVFWWNQPYYWKKGSATVSHNDYGSCWYLNVDCMLASQVTRTESYVYVVAQA